MKLSIIIPVYNEAATFEALIEKVLAVKIPRVTKEIIIIESNSLDGTNKLVQKYEKKCKVLYQEKAMGKGNALKYGFQYATGDIILIQDADLEYKPEEYPKLLQPILENKTSFVLGSRPMGKDTWKIRTYLKDTLYARLLNVGGLLYNTLFNILYGVHLTDPSTMYKVFKKECIKDITFKCDYFDLDWEIVAKLVKKGYIPTEVPITYTSRSLHEGKKIRFVRDGLLVLWAILRFRFFD